MTPTTSMPAWLESAWLARYLDRQLSDDETAWFEAYLLDKPELLGMVEADGDLRDSLEKIKALEPGRSVALDSERGYLQVDQAVQGKARRRLAVAAMLVLTVGVGWLGRDAVSPSAPIEDLVVNPTHVVYDTMRGEASSPNIEHRLAVSPYVLVEVAIPSDAKDVVLIVGNHRATQMSPSADGFVSFLISRREFAPNTKVRLSYVSNGVGRNRDLQFFDLGKETSP